MVDLNRFETAADAAAATKDDPELFASLAQRAADETTTLVCLSTLAPALTAVVARWRRSGLPGQEVEEAEAELVAEVLAVLRGRSALPALHLPAANPSWLRLTRWDLPLRWPAN